MKYTLLITLLIAGCASSPLTTSEKPYIDLKGFFEAEIVRLENLKPQVNKTVSQNSLTETRSLNSINWTTELSLFAESDINKPAWKDSYKIKNQGDNIVYTSADSSLRTRQIHLLKDEKGRLRKVKIINRVSNMLYSSSEILVYVPDSLYQITKRQHVVFVGNNEYKIQGLFKEKTGI